MCGSFSLNSQTKQPPSREWPPPLVLTTLIGWSHGGGENSYLRPVSSQVLREPKTKTTHELSPNNVPSSGGNKRNWERKRERTKAVRETESNNLAFLPLGKCNMENGVGAIRVYPNPLPPVFYRTPLCVWSFYKECWRLGKFSPLRNSQLCLYPRLMWIQQTLYNGLKWSQITWCVSG